MAIQIMVAVKDKVAGFFQSPFFVPAQGVATRAFADQVNSADPNNQFHKHYADFSLWLLGQFDDETCAFMIHDKPVLLLEGEAAKTE